MKITHLLYKNCKWIAVYNVEPEDLDNPLIIAYRTEDGKEYQNEKGS